MLNKNVEVFMGCDTGWHFASTVLFGAPFDSTTSYRPGTRFGSSAIRRESYGIESYSPYQDRDLLDGDVVDVGDLELCFGDSRAALDAITEQTRLILASHKRPFMLGGEHLVTLGAFRAVAENSPMYTSSILMHTLICGRITSVFPSPTPVSFDAAGNWLATVESSSLESAQATGKNFSGDVPM
jgi:agmatinase: agmatinase